MKHLKRYVNVAINKDYMDVQKYAFRKYKIKSVEGRHSHLSPEELHKLEENMLNCKRQKIPFYFAVTPDYDTPTLPI